MEIAADESSNSALPDWSGNIKPTCSASAISSCTIRRWPKTPQETISRPIGPCPLFGALQRKNAADAHAVNVCRDSLFGVVPPLTAA
ncbi:MAG: hypothetical protein ACLS6G_11945 [Christensenellales bacterium]